MRMPISENFSPIQRETKLEKFNKNWNWTKKRTKIKLKKKKQIWFLNLVSRGRSQFT